MATKKIDAYLHECDGCEKSTTSIEEGIPAGWLSGVATDGFGSGEWLACKRTCINKAVLAAVTGPNS